MRVRTPLHGEIELRKRFERLKKRTPEIVAEAGYEEMKVEAQEAREVTPVLTGALRETVRAIEPMITPRTITSGLTAGGPSAPHALIVHEDLEAEHEVGGPKYLERTLNASAAHIMRRIGNRISFSKV